MAQYSWMPEPKMTPKERIITIVVLFFVVMGIVVYGILSANGKASGVEDDPEDLERYTDCKYTRGICYTWSLPDGGEAEIENISCYDSSLDIDLLIKDGHDHEYGGFCYVLCNGYYAESDIYTKPKDSNGYTPTSVSVSAYEVGSSHPEEIKLVLCYYTEIDDRWCLHTIDLHGLEYEFLGEE